MCFISVNVTECTNEFVSLFLHSSFYVSGTGISSASYSLGSLIHMRIYIWILKNPGLDEDIYLNPQNPGLGI